MDTAAQAKRCTIEDIGLSINGRDETMVRTALNQYLSAFAAPTKKPEGGIMTGSISCLKCGGPLS